MKSRAESRGAITVEAAIVLPIFICVVISLAMLIKLVYIHDVIQHSIDEATNELAAYSYIYHISDLQQVDDSIQDTIEANSGQAREHTEAFVGAYETMEKSLKSGRGAAEDIAEVAAGQGNWADNMRGILEQAPAIYNTGAELTGENIESIKRLRQVLEEAGKDPRKEAESIAWMLSEGMYSDIKTIIAEPIVRQTVKKYLEQDNYMDVNRRLNKLNIVGNFNGMDFYSSSFFKGNQDIDIIVKYKVELPLPIKLLPDIYMVQRSTARAWLDGGDGTALKQTDIWALPNKQRGLKIEEMFGGNLPYDFPVIDIYEQATNTGTSIKSINLNAKTYQNGEALRKKLVSYVDALKEKDEISYKNNNYKLANKKLVLVIPKDSLNDNNRSIIEQIKSYAEANGIQPSINEL